MLIAIACFVGVVGVFLTLYWAFILRPEATAERALDRRLDPAGKTNKKERVSLLNRVAPRSSLPWLDGVFHQSSTLVQPVDRLLQRSGLRLTVGQLVLGTMLMAGSGFVLVLALTKTWWVAGVAAAMLALVPTMLVRWRASRRVAKFEEQFPEAIDLIARALRAGHAFTTGLSMAADELSEPAKAEFKLMYDRQNYGLPLGEAMKQFAERVPLLDARFFVTAVLTQREAGGNLAEVLDSLAALIRERFKLKRQVRVLSAHGRITGWVLGMLPIVLGLVLFAIAPQHISTLFTDPIGLRMVAVVAVGQVIGFYAMRRIVDIEI